MQQHRCLCLFCAGESIDLDLKNYMYHLAIDIGNTNIKAAVFESKELVCFVEGAKQDLSFISRLFEQYAITKAIALSVDEDVEMLSALVEAHVPLIRFSVAQSNGLQNQYSSPHTLGLDRWAAALACWGAFPNAHSLVIDAGTCITYEFVHAQGYYAGGQISPGIWMRFKAMHTFTGRLPMIEFSADAEIPLGNSTLNAMTRGALNGLLYEVEGVIQEYKTRYGAINIIITGGDAHFIYKNLKCRNFAPSMLEDRHWVLKGLNEVITA